MSPFSKALVVLLATASSAGCGKVSSDTWLLGADQQESKVTCPGDHQGFHVCMSESSSIASKALEATMLKALSTSLPQVVDSAAFKTQLEAAFTTQGKQIVADLVGANYIVEITGYCDASDDALAKAPVGGASIKYNECRVQTAADGAPDLAAVAGVLLHEISHNLGYTHPDVNPSRGTVPYYVGDLAEKELGGTVSRGSFVNGN